jgi:transcriptional regulator with XRE-family HTH domain
MSLIPMSKQVSAPAVLDAHDVDRTVGSQMRKRRLMLGLSQQQMGTRIGVTNQQVRHYETGVCRVSAGRLHQIAAILEVKVGYFFEGLRPTCDVAVALPYILPIGLVRHFAALQNPRHQEAVCQLARALADHEGTQPHPRVGSRS